MTDRDWHLYRAECAFLDSIHPSAWRDRAYNEVHSWYWLLLWAGWRE
jgi:hypothetical protein